MTNYFIYQLKNLWNMKIIPFNIPLPIAGDGIYMYHIISIMILLTMSGILFWIMRNTR